MDELRNFDEIVIACGVRPRVIRLPGSDQENVVDYAEVLSGNYSVGRRVAIIGAGGIGFDMAVYLLHATNEEPDTETFLHEWGIDESYQNAGGLGEVKLQQVKRQIYLLQRKKTKPGAGLGKTTGWIHRSVLKKHGVKMLNGVEYLGIDESGLRILVNGEEQVLEVDDVVLCAGQTSQLELVEKLEQNGIAHHIIGGARKAAEIDAKRAILEGVRLADSL